MCDPHPLVEATVLDSTETSWQAVKCLLGRRVLEIHSLHPYTATKIRSSISLLSKSCNYVMMLSHGCPAQVRLSST